MRRKRFPSLLRQFLTILTLSVTLLSTTWAKPKFKILHGVPGGLFTGLVLDGEWNLYGTTSGGGTHNCGTVFELSPGAHGWALTTIHDFNCSDGGGFKDSLILDAAGNLFGTSPAGGQYSYGDVFEIAPGSGGWDFKVLYEFCQIFHCPDGGDPSGLVMDKAGNLYGVAAGGAYSAGVIYKLMPGSDGWNESVLYNFDGSRKSGVGPSGPLTFDTSGNLYGTTSVQNIYESGTVFRLMHHSGGKWNETPLFRFNGADGASPYDGVIFDKAGRLYGTTVGGGASGYGVVFKLTRKPKGMWKEDLLYEFPNPVNGSFPSSGLVFDKSGNVYGTTSNGGNPECNGGCGVVYKLTPAANGKWRYSVLHKFTGQDGGYPGGGLAIDCTGNLYGTAYSVVFEITP